jgi:hypothetical protein
MKYENIDLCPHSQPLFRKLGRERGADEEIIYAL